MLVYTLLFEKSLSWFESKLRYKLFNMQGCGEAHHVVRPAPCGCSITVITWHCQCRDVSSTLIIRSILELNNKNGWTKFNSRSPQCGNSSIGRMSPCQGEGCGFESRLPLKLFKILNPVVVPVLGEYIPVYLIKTKAGPWQYRGFPAASEKIRVGW